MEKLQNGFRYQYGNFTMGVNNKKVNRYGEFVTERQKTAQTHCRFVLQNINLNKSLFEVEVSLEGNPGDMLGMAPGLQAAGVTRVSVGVQALNDRDLNLLNRDHSAKDALQAVEESMKVFPEFTSADLIFGRPQHTLEVWLEELKTLVMLGLPHLSMYQLTVERGTRLWNQVPRCHLVGGQLEYMNEIESGA